MDGICGVPCSRLYSVCAVLRSTARVTSTPGSGSEIRRMASVSSNILVTINTRECGKVHFLCFYWCYVVSAFLSVSLCFPTAAADDLRHGNGKMTFFCGSFMEEIYEGNWDADERHNLGTYIYRTDEGCVYVGNWVRGVRCGEGKLTFLDGSFYRGEFREDQMWGKGIYVDATDGTQYDGEWYKNMRQGFGTLIDNLGAIYHGEFWANMKHGPGQQHNLDGSVYGGKWEGNLVKGFGSVTVPVGTGPLGGPTEVKVKVFGF